MLGQGDVFEESWTWSAGKRVEEAGLSDEGKNRSDDSQCLSEDGKVIKMGLGKGKVSYGRKEMLGRTWEMLLTCSSQNRYIWETNTGWYSQPPGQVRLERGLWREGGGRAW